MSHFSVVCVYILSYFCKFPPPLAKKGRAGRSCSRNRSQVCELCANKVLLPNIAALLRVQWLTNVVPDAFCIRRIKRQAATAVLFTSPRAPASSHKVPETSKCTSITLLQRDLTICRLTTTPLNRSRASSTYLPTTTFHHRPYNLPSLSCQTQSRVKSVTHMTSPLFVLNFLPGVPHFRIR